MNRVWPALAALVMLFGSWSGARAAAQKKATVRKPNSAAVKRPAANTAVTKHSSAGTTQAKAANKDRRSMAKARPAPQGRASSARRGKKPVRRGYAPRQTVPTADRYKEIQSALAVKGYLPPEQVTGEWTPASAEALKKFQDSQNLSATGRISALSLIALGLGPRHDGADRLPPAGITGPVSVNPASPVNPEPVITSN